MYNSFSNYLCNQLVRGYYARLCTECAYIKQKFNLYAHAENGYNWHHVTAVTE